MHDDERRRFNIAEAKPFDPKLLVADEAKSDDDKTNALILTLALIFNDIKDLMWWADRLFEFAPAIKRVDGQTGEFSGMELHIARLLVGIINEFLVTIEENKTTTNSSRFQTALASLPADLRGQWVEAVTGSSNGVTKHPLRSRFASIRATGTYHYHQVLGLMKGYREFASGDMKAYYSAGPVPEQCRFFFADAAVQQAIAGYLPADVPLADLLHYVSPIATSIFFVVDRYLEHRWAERKNA